MHPAPFLPAAPAPRAERTLVLPTGLAMTFSCRPLAAEAVELTLERVLEDCAEERK